MYKYSEWSEESSKDTKHLILFADMPFNTQKSSKSGIFWGSLGQYVGEPVDTHDRLRCDIALNSSRPLVELRREPQAVCLAL